MSGFSSSVSPLKTVKLSDNARVVLEKRYLRKGSDGKPSETISEMFWRVAYNVAKAEETWGGESKVLETATEFFDLLTDLKFFPNSPTFTGAGTPLGQLAACFVLKIDDDMGKTGSGIFQTLRDAALIQQTGGGNGFSFSRLRPKNTLVNSSAGSATGPVGFLKVYDKAFGEVAQGGSRRGANMAVLRIDHPDIEEFITCKTDETSITNFNISVGITDEFMRAVVADADWDLRFPDVMSPYYKDFNGTIDQAQAAGIPIKVYKTIKAKVLFEKIVKQAHHNGEPGLLFIDAANRENPVPHLYALEATNPCGEQWLGPYENCCLGSINLAKHLGDFGTVDWEGLRNSVVLCTRFLDDVIDANAYVPAVPQLKEAAYKARRIGLGIMGLGDLLYHVGIRYGSTESEEFASQVVEFIRYHCMLTSIDLAKERGSFPAIKGSIYDSENMLWAPKSPAVPYTNLNGRPEINWRNVEVGLQEFGIRNSCQMTVAPTGTIATVAGCEAYGCEPAFALAYIRHVNDGGKDLQLTYTSPLFEKAMVDAGLSETTRQKIIEQVMLTGTCQGIKELPDNIRTTFVVSQDISAEAHVRMQAAIQRFVDNSLSKTCNFSETAGEDDVSKAYLLAWKLGCKGLTVYITGSREKVVLETKATVKSKAQAVVKEDQAHATKKPRPVVLEGRTVQVNTPLGKTFVTINENGGSQPFEAFISTAKAGSETAAISEAIGRLISYILRLSSPVAPKDRLEEVVNQLGGIGSGRSIGFGPNRVASLPDGVARALNQYLGTKNSQELQPATVQSKISSNKIGDLCPECGEAALVNEEGCRKCYSCGYSQC